MVGESDQLRGRGLSVLKPTNDAFQEGQQIDYFLDQGTNLDQGKLIAVLPYCKYSDQKFENLSPTLSLLCYIHKIIIKNDKFLGFLQTSFLILISLEIKDHQW